MRDKIIWQERAGVCMVAGASVLYGIIPLLIKKVLLRGMAVSCVITYRFLLMAVLTAVVSVCSRKSMRITVRLLSAIPKVDVENKVSRIVLKGDVPSPINPKPGCRFAPRCWMAEEKCFKEAPELKEVCPGHCVACHFANMSREKMKTAATVEL